MNKLFSHNYLNINIFPNTHNPNKFYKFPIKFFAIPLSFKNKINMFYKHVHPDVLGSNCPADLRKVNEKSVQDINAYMDSLDKMTKFENKNLTFYVAITQLDKNKENETKTVFTKFNVNLEEIKPNTSATNKVTLQLNLNNYIDEVLTKIKKMKNEASKGKFIEELNNFSNKLENEISLDEENLDRIKVLKDDDVIKTLQSAITQGNIRNISQATIIKEKQKKLTQKIDRAMNPLTDFFENRKNPDPIAKELVNNLKNLKDVRYFGDNFFPTGLIFFDEKLKDEQIVKFISHMKLENINGFDKVKTKMAFRKIALEMCHHNSLIRLYISDFYSFDYMPGSLTIPFNFEFTDLINYYQENKPELYRIKKRFLEENKSIDIVKESLIKSFKFGSVNIYNENNSNLDHIQNLHINLKKLNKILTQKFKDLNFEGFELNIIINKEKENISKNSDEDNFFKLNMYMPINNDKQVEDVVNSKLNLISNNNYIKV